MLWQLIVAGAERHIVAWFVGGLFAIMATTISVLDLSESRRRRAAAAAGRVCVRVNRVVGCGGRSDACSSLPRPKAAEIRRSDSLDGAAQRRRRRRRPHALVQVPIYAIESWLSLRFKEQALWFESARDWCVRAPRVCA